MEGGPNQSGADLLRYSAQPEDQDFKDILNDHISDFMQEQRDLSRADDIFKAGQTHEDDFRNIMHAFLHDDKELLQHGITTRSHENIFGDTDVNQLISLSLDSHDPESIAAAGIPGGKKKDLKDNKKFQDFLLGEDEDISAENVYKSKVKRI